MKYIVNVSGGLSSYEALRRTLAAHGHENTVAVFADTKGMSANPHDGEDEDLYRFLDDIERYLDIPIVRLSNGRTVWQVINKEKLIKDTRSGYTPCSATLKRDTIDRYVKHRYFPEDCRLVFGMKWDEVNRMTRLSAHKAPYVCEFPLAEKPYVENEDIIQQLHSVGIEEPRLYRQGFNYNNCGGFCVRAGKTALINLLRTNRERYLYHEQQELDFIQRLSKKRQGKHTVVSITDPITKKLVPVTLQQLRLMVEANEIADGNEHGACGCFVGGHETGDES